MGRRRVHKRGRDEYPFVWDRLAKPKGRKGHRCKIVGKGRVPELALVEFESDGKPFYVVRAGLKRARGE